jgi:hypothetical protein
MANIQHVANRIFRHVDASQLPASYANVMGALIDAYGDDPDFHAWIDTVHGGAVEKLIACMVRKGKWNDAAWLREYIQEASLKETAA